MSLRKELISTMRLPTDGFLLFLLISLAVLFPASFSRVPGMLRSRYGANLPVSNHATSTPTYHRTSSNAEADSQPLHWQNVEPHRVARRSSATTCCPKVHFTASYFDVSSVGDCTCFASIELNGNDCSQPGFLALAIKFAKVVTIRGDLKLKGLSGCALVIEFTELQVIEGSILIEDIDNTSDMFKNLKTVVPPPEICNVTTVLKFKTDPQTIENRVKAAILTGTTACIANRSTTTTTTSTTPAPKPTSSVDLAALSAKNTETSESSTFGFLPIWAVALICIIIGLVLIGASGGGGVLFVLKRVKSKDGDKTKDDSQGKQDSPKSKKTSQKAASTSTSSSQDALSQATSSHSQAGAPPQQVPQQDMPEKIIRKEYKRKKVVPPKDMGRTVEFAYIDHFNDKWWIKNYQNLDDGFTCGQMKKMSDEEFQKAVYEYQRYPIDCAYRGRIEIEYNRRVEERWGKDPASRAYIKKGKYYLPPYLSTKQLTALFNKQEHDPRHTFVLRCLWYGDIPKEPTSVVKSVKKDDPHMI